MTQAVLQDGLVGPAAGSVDPVCGMTIDPAKAAGRAEHGGRIYHFCSGHCLSEFQRDPAGFVSSPAATSDATLNRVPTTVGSGLHEAGRPLQAVLRRAESGQAKDPVCGMVVDKATALRTDRAGRSYYFCSAGCQRTFESPEAELKSMRTRVTIALTGVLALAIMRAGAFIALATGATLLTWVPIPALP